MTPPDVTGRPKISKDNNHLSHCLFTHDCVAMHASNSIIKFADDTTVVGLITNNDETAYWEEVRALGVWCQKNNKGDDRGL